MAITTTTLSAAVSTKSERKIKLASASGVDVGDLLRVNEEGMLVTNILGTTIEVIRGWNTKAATHASGAAVYIGTPVEFAPPVIQFVGASLTNTAGSTSGTGSIAVLIEGTLRYIPVSDSVS